MILYECGVRYEKTADNGMTKKVTELYLVDACSFAEAEGRITQEMQPYISGDFDVVTIKRTNYSEIVEGLSTADKWFDIDNAHRVVVEHRKGSVMDYEIATRDETKIMDLFRYKVNTSSNG